MSAATSFTDGDLFSCKISLKYCKSPVWRRVLVPVDYTFKDLHDVIMAVMEWDDCHLHMFKFKHPIFGNPIEINGPNVVEHDDQNICYLPESSPIASFVKRLKQKIQYEYDFGCSWEHVIEFEKIVDASCNVSYPKCIRGKGMPPPENDPDSERTEVFGMNRMDANLSRRCRQVEKVLKSNSVNSVSEKHSSTTPSANQSTDLKEPNEPPAKKRAIDTDQPSTSSSIPVETNLLKDETVDSNTGENSSTAFADVKTKVKPLQESPARRLAEDSSPFVVLPSNSAQTDFSTIPSVYDNAINNSPRRSDELISTRCRRCEGMEDMDYEDFYGKHVATNLKLVTDREMRANLRKDIQLAINKYSKFQKQI